MGRITRRSTDQEKPQRKRRKKDLDRIHSKILQAKQKLDNVGKGDNKGQKKQGQAKICKRLLPEPAAGIYRNGAKGKDIQKAKTLANTYHKARLKADALKLFNGDTHESKHIVEIPINKKTTKQSTNKDCIKNNLELDEWTLCTQEQSPVLGKKQNQNQKLCLTKKKVEENVFENIDSNKIKKQYINDELRHVHKEDVCKRRLFQNDREQLETITTPAQIFDNTDLTKENKPNDKAIEPICLKSNKDSLCDPLNRYMEFCRIISAENFETDILKNFPSDPVTSTIRKLRHVYADSFRQQLLRRKNKQELESAKSTNSIEYQACISSDTSQLSPVDFEVPKCSENPTTAARLQEGVSQKNNKFHLIQNAKLKKSDDITRHNFTSCSSRNTFTHNTNGLVIENCENSDNQCSKQSKDIRQLAKSTNFYITNEKDSNQLDFQKNPNYVNHILKSKRYDKDNFSIDIPDYRNSRHIDNSKLLGTSMFLSDSVLSKRYFSKNYFHEKLPIVSDNCASNNVPKECNNRTANKCNVKNVERIPTILRRCSDITINKPNHFVQINVDDKEDLYKKCETNLFNRNNGTKKELYETALPNSFKNITPSLINAIFDQTKILEPQIGSMKIKDSQESQVEQFNINMRPKEHNEKNEFCQYNESLYPQSFETSCNVNAEKLLQREQISPDIRKHLCSNRYHPINYLQGVNFSNSNVESTKQFRQQIKLHEAKQEIFRKNTRDQNQNILFNNVNDRTMPILNVPQNTAEKRCIESCRKNLFSKTECTKSQINQNTCHCNEQYIYFDSANCSRKYKEQAHHFHKEVAQPESLCNTRGYNNSIDNCVNLSSTTRNIPLLTLRQKNNLYMYPKAVDQHRTVLLQNVTQPVKYLAVENDSNIQRIPVYINDKNVRVAENVPLVTLIDPNTQTKAFPQEIAKQIVPLQTDNLHFNNFATHEISNQSFVKHLDSVNAILLNPDLQSNIWYASNL